MKMFTVGPVMMDEEILNVAGKQLPYFRTDEFSAVMFEIEQNLKELMNSGADSKAIVLTGSGTSAMEAVVAGSLDEHDRVLIINGGSFGARFVKLCEIYQIPHEQISLAYGEALTREHLNQVNDPSSYTTLLVNLHETSTGQLYDIDLLSSFAKQHGLTLIVDAISTFLADAYDMDHYGIDCTIISSQKALALSPGISMVVMKDKFYTEKVLPKPQRNLYLNLVEHVENMKRGQTPYTPAVGIILELQERLRMILQEGVHEVEQRTAELAQEFRKKAKEHHLLVPKSYPLSNALTPLYFPDGEAKDLYEFLKDRYGIYVTPSGGANQHHLLRIGHLGDLESWDYDTLLNCIDAYYTQKKPKQMKMFLMAAGMGTRISSTTNQPKSLLDIGGMPLIEHTVQLLMKNHIEVNIILGYKGELIKEALRDYPITYYENPFYRETNSIASLWFARAGITDDADILLANADVFWQQDILNQLLACDDEVVLLADRTRRLSGDYFFHCEGRELLRYGKEMAEEDRTSEYVGIAKIKKTFIPNMVKQMNHLISKGDYHLWWENTLYTLIGQEKIMVEDIDGKFWSEIDTLSDYERIIAYIKNHPGII